MRKKIESTFHTLAHQAFNHIWFPKKTREGYIFRYGVTILLGLFVVLTIIMFPDKEFKSITYCLFLLTIVLSTFFGNMINGFLLTGFATSTIALSYFGSSSVSFLMIGESIIFLVVGLLVSTIIDRAKRAKLSAEFGRREALYQQQIVLLTAEKEKALDEIRIREEFISIASHELKTPLTSTLLKLQLVLHNVRNVTLANFSVQNLLSMLESAELQSKRLSRMINDLLNVSMIRTGRLELEKEECNITEIAKEVFGRFNEKAEKEGVTLHLYTKGDILGKYDRVRLEQVISNLISNAMKYGKGKPVEIKVTKQGNTAKISVKDNGIGISKDNKVKIFNLFERGVQNHEYKGLGIGLYITNQIVTAHNGKIVVMSRPNQGSEFIVEIPITK